MTVSVGAPFSWNGTCNSDPFDGDAGSTGALIREIVRC